MKLKTLFLMAFATLFTVACSDDEPVQTPPATQQLKVDATDYTEWHYIDLATQRVTTLSVNEPAPASWDLAIHRYDVKTNGGRAVETDVKDFASLPATASFPEKAWVADEWTTNRIIVDRSQMMNGIVKYAEDYLNPCVSRWLKVDTSSMPPKYALSGKVYLLRLKDGSVAALRLANFMNDQGVKGHMTVDYQYPVQP